MLGSLEAGVTHRAWFSSTLDDRTAFQDDNTSSRGLSFLTWDEGTVLSGEVPEPSTIVLMSTLLLGSGALRLRKRGLGRGGPAR
jgi:hypothetical protein